VVVVGDGERKAAMKDSRARLAAMAVGAATTVVLIFTGLAHANPSQRPDVFLLAGVAVIQVVVAAAWAAPWPRMPRLAVLSYGVLLIAVGFGSLAGPISSGGSLIGAAGMGTLIPWAWIAMTIAGPLMVLASVLATRTTPKSNSDQLDVGSRE
jgi:hypothetical protein